MIKGLRFLADLPSTARLMWRVSGRPQYSAPISFCRFGPHPPSKGRGPLPESHSGKVARSSNISHARKPSGIAKALTKVSA